MEGELKDPVGFQVDCLPTGSISFGQFDAESLCWERTSSFSRNRYLEEVNKYSRPGSVIKKKAYFEAHFKRKALLRQAASSEAQNGIGYQNNENDILDDMNYMEDFDDNGNEATDYAPFQDGIENRTSENDTVDNMNYMEDFEEDGNEGTHYAQYDETPDGSDEHEHEATDCPRGEEISSDEFQMSSIATNGNVVVDDDIQKEKPDEILEDQFGCSTLLLQDDNSQVEPKRKLETEAEISKTEAEQKHTIEVDHARLEVQHSEANQVENADGFLMNTDQLVKNSNIRMDHTSKKRQNPSLNVKTTMEQKTTRPKVQTRVPGAQIRRKISNRTASLSSAKAFIKTPTKIDRDSPLTTKIERQSPLKVPPTPSTLQKSLKPKDSANTNEKLNQGNRRVRDLKAKKLGTLPQPAAEKGQLEGRRYTSRSKRITNPAKPELKSNGAVFKFKSDERAEKRKEFFLKLEEKQHAKEAEMNQIHARTQEETEAELKHLRRSLNFKATPMPSFYHGAGPRSSSGKKAVMTHAKSPEPRSKSTSPGSRASASGNFRASPKNGKQQGPHSDCETAKTSLPTAREAADCNGASEAKDINSTRHLSDGSDRIDEMGSQNQVSQAGRKTEGAKKDREKGKVISSGMQKQDVDTTDKVRKGEREKTKRPEVRRKAMKDVVSRSSEMGRLAVHVAS